MQPVKIEWVDSCYTGGWHAAEDYNNEPSPCVSYGVIVKRSRQAITVVQSVGKKHYSEAMTIPRSVIRKITPLKEA